MLEQRDMGAHAAALAEGANVARNVLHQSMVLLKEYKRALITTAVTGELDVTTARPLVSA
ncbi:MAG: hypothetical protein ACYC90_15310 [Candidatus Nanopelagicales bacterium]